MAPLQSANKQQSWSSTWSTKTGQRQMRLWPITPMSSTPRTTKKIPDPIPIHLQCPSRSSRSVVKPHSCLNKTRISWWATFCSHWTQWPWWRLLRINHRAWTTILPSNVLSMLFRMLFTTSLNLTILSGTAFKISTIWRITRIWALCTLKLLKECKLLATTSQFATKWVRCAHLNLLRLLLSKSQKILIDNHCTIWSRFSSQLLSLPSSVISLSISRPSTWKSWSKFARFSTLATR